MALLISAGVLLWTLVLILTLRFFRLGSSADDCIEQAYRQQALQVYGKPSTLHRDHEVSSTESTATVSARAPFSLTA